MDHSEGGKCYLIAAGTRYYDHESWDELPGVDRDIQDFRDYYRPQLGFEVVTDDWTQNATAQEFVEGLENCLTDEVQEGDSVLLYYSGHGFVHARKHFLAFRGSKKGKMSGALSTEYLAALLANCRARQVVIILDVCSAGFGIESIEKHLVELETDPLQEGVPLPEVYFWAVTQVWSDAYEREFVPRFIAGLREFDPRVLSHVPAESLFKTLQGKMPSYQEPKLISRLVGECFLFPTRKERRVEAETPEALYEEFLSHIGGAYRIDETLVRALYFAWWPVADRDVAVKLRGMKGDLLLKYVFERFVSLTDSERRALWCFTLHYARHLEETGSSLVKWVQSQTEQKLFDYLQAKVDAQARTWDSSPVLQLVFVPEGSAGRRAGETFRSDRGNLTAWLRFGCLRKLDLDIDSYQWTLENTEAGDSVAAAVLSAVEAARKWLGPKDQSKMVVELFLTVQDVMRPLDSCAIHEGCLAESKTTSQLLLWHALGVRPYERHFSTTPFRTQQVRVYHLPDSQRANLKEHWEEEWDHLKVQRYELNDDEVDCGDLEAGRVGGAEGENRNKPILMAARSHSDGGKVSSFVWAVVDCLIQQGKPVACLPRCCSDHEGTNLKRIKSVFAKQLLKDWPQLLQAKRRLGWDPLYCNCTLICDHPESEAPPDPAGDLDLESVSDQL